MNVLKISSFCRRGVRLSNYTPHSGVSSIQHHEYVKFFKVYQSSSLGLHSNFERWRCPQIWSPAPHISSVRWNQTSPSDKDSAKDIVQEEMEEKLSLFKRYKKMLKEYWYVLIPVHWATSLFWFGSFYYAAKSGLDIVPFLEYINVPEKFIEPVRNSALGHIAVASALYKVATPARYMVTLGGTTYTIKFLTRRGLIRPAPTKAQLKTIIQKKLKKDDNPAE